jgi:hypothetical protein
MPIKCPYCLRPSRDLFALSLRLEDDHPESASAEFMVAVIVHPLATSLPGIDIDAVHRKYGAVAVDPRPAHVPPVSVEQGAAGNFQHRGDGR